MGTGNQRVGILEMFGLRPFGSAMRESWVAIAGEGLLPRSQWGLSSVRIFKPPVSFRTWLGRTRGDRKLPIYNLFNRVPAPRDQGYSVKVSYARDFRGGQLTYDGHDGTDFAVPVGTPVVAAAPGRVIKLFREMNRGGLKLIIDHGAGLITVACHLSRALVEVGKEVARGDVVALSGASGIDLLFFFPWVAPHVHFTVLLDGEPIDPFAAPDEVSMWRSGHNSPTPHDGSEAGDFAPSEYSESAVANAIAACRDPELRARIEAIEPL